MWGISDSGKADRIESPAVLVTRALPEGLMLGWFCFIYTKTSFLCEDYLEANPRIFPFARKD